MVNDQGRILKKNREVPLDEERDQSRSPKIMDEKGQTRSGCIQEQLVKFREAEPKRAEVIEFILKGFSTEEIRLILGRSYGATREFMSQCRKKFRPFIEICNEIEEYNMMKNKEQKILQDWIDTLQGFAVRGMDIKTRLEARLLRNAWIAENKKIENEIPDQDDAFYHEY